MLRYCVSLLFLFSGCQDRLSYSPAVENKESVNHYKTAGDIPPPLGYEPVTLASSSFGAWLRELPLKKNNTVYLFNGSKKYNQDAQFAVVDLPTGDKDLQQCADALLHLKALYFIQSGKAEQLAFTGTDGTLFSFARWKEGQRFRKTGNKLESYQVGTRYENDSAALDSYLENVYTWCGTYSLYHETLPLFDMNDLQPGDVLIKPGAPGHAMLVTNVAEKGTGEKVFMLLQSYMPAQDMHIVKNPLQKNSAWYYLKEGDILTPEWHFSTSQLRRWKM